MLATGVQLKKCPIVEECSKKCIICQADENIPCVALEPGKSKIQEYARIRKDIVFDRLQRFGTDFVYHTGNKCYKAYTHKKHLPRIEPTFNEDPNVDLTSINNSSLEINAQDEICVVCGRKTYKKQVQKCRISEFARAESFLEAKSYFGDDVNDRTKSLTSVEDVLKANLYCHKNCIRSYIGKFNARSDANENLDGSPLKRDVIKTFLETLTEQLKSGIGFSLTDVRNSIKNVHGIDTSNRFIETCLKEVFGNTIKFSKSKAANVSKMFFHETVQVEDIAEVLRSKDDIRDCAQTLRYLFKKYDFGLENEFCDANNLESAWQNIQIPEPILNFYAELCNFNASDFEKMRQSKASNQNEDLEDLPAKISNSKCLKITSLFQIMHYLITNGTQRTPLHIMNGLAIHDACRSSTVIKSLNHIGVSISYDEVLRHRNDLARYTIHASDESIPIPSHLDVNNFTIAAFDNFDHNEATFTGLGSSHDTVSVLFQDTPENKLKKPKLRETGIKHGSRTFKEVLSCQKIKDFLKMSNTITLPENYSLPKGAFSMDPIKYSSIKKKEFAWDVCRFEGSKDSTKQIIPPWAAFNSFLSEEHLRSTQIVGFLPIIPSPVTEYSTVYTALHNFLKVLRQLKQSKLPVTCDEGVYKIARHITLMRPDEFSDIILLLGPFHLAKCVFACIGKYLRGSGGDLIFTESSVFGPAVTESVLNGKNYVRSFKGFVILSETLRRLQLEEFFKTHDVNNYEAELKNLQELKEGFVKKQSNTCKEKFNEFIRLPGNLQNDFEAFIKKRCAESELFKYWNNVLYMISLAKDLVRSDRESNWPLQLETVQKLLPIIAAFDRTNYLRWLSLYLEDMRQLEATSPEVYEKFMDGSFTVKRSTRSFSSVGADMGLEQTINRSKKSTSGVIGCTRNKNFVTEWELIYHEVLGVSNVYRDITNVNSSNNHELRFHHEFTESETDEMEHHIKNMKEFILRHENPFMDGNNTLRNIITQEEVSSDNKDEILTAIEIGNKVYEAYRQDRFVNRTQTISSVIHHTSIPQFCSKVKTQQDGNTQSNKKSYATAQRMIDLARERQFSLERLFTFELVNTEYLFDQNGDLTEPSNITTELEKYMPQSATEPSPQSLSCCYVVVVMQYLKKMPVSKIKTFGDLAKSFFKLIGSIVDPNANRIDFIFNACDALSPKNALKRHLERCSIKIHKIDEHTPLPIKMDMFWASIENERKIHIFLKNYIPKAFEFLQCQTIFFSVFDEEGNLECGSYELSTETVSLRHHTEFKYSFNDEILRVMPHVNHATKCEYEKVVVLPGETDVIVPVIHYWKELNINGLQELWMRVGSGTTSRLMPIHTLANTLGKDVCENLIAIHLLTGSRCYTSKFGTKNGALKTTDYSLLKNFGRQSKNLLENILENAEKFLIHLIKKDTSCNTMDELRMWYYHHSKNASLEKIPPTSRMTRQHILRAFYWTHMQLTCLSNFKKSLTLKNMVTK